MLNPKAWANPTGGQFGGATYYNDYRQQRHPFENVAFGRDFRLLENVKLNVRVELTNMFNRAYINNPTSTNALTPQVQATTASAVNTGFGAISWQNTGGQRQGQMVFRLSF